MKETHTLAGKTVNIFVPDSCDNNLTQVIYLNGGYEDADAIWEMFSYDNIKSALVTIDVTREWNDALTPWEAPRLFKGGEDFGGKAKEYGNLLKGIMLIAEDRIQQMMGILPQHRALSGYSLAGLFAVYSFYKTDVFDRLASMSGSLWFDGFSDFMKENDLKRVPEKVYLSLGDKEKKTRNQRMATVEECTQTAAGIFRDAGSETLFELNAGGHFDDEVERIVKGLRFIAD
ncbi:MAG: alpha/beta hydrolase [Firmicutes bacterium]|nr:alpha/beta hydrolase [Bacillota bacterium]